MRDGKCRLPGLMVRGIAAVLAVQSAGLRPAAAAPTNDECSNAIAISGAGLFAFDATGATPSLANACIPNIIPDIWFRWTPTCSGAVTISTCGLTPICVNTSLAVYESIVAGSTCQPASPVLIFNDDNLCTSGTGLQSMVRFNAVVTNPATSYLIRLGAAGPANCTPAGQFLISLACGTSVATPMTMRCENFDAGANGWTGDNVTLDIAGPGPSGTPADHYLRATDEGGPSIIHSSGRFRGDWTNLLSTGCASLCFDFQVFNDGDPQQHLAINPTIDLVHSQNPAIAARFTSNTVVTEPGGSNPGWHRICAPIARAYGGALPQSTAGTWNMLNGSDPCRWNELLADVTEIQMDFDYTSFITEVVGIDNVCVQPEPCPCDAAVTNGSVMCDPDNAGNYLYTFTVTNNSSVVAYYASFVPLSGTTYTPSFVALNSPLGIGNGQSAAVTTIIHRDPPVVAQSLLGSLTLLDQSLRPICTLEIHPTLNPCPNWCAQLIAAGPPAVTTGGDFTFSFTLVNYTADTLEHLFVIPVSPANTTFMPQYIHLNPAVPPGGTRGPITITIQGVAPGTNVCFRISLHDAIMRECCSVQHCVRLGGFCCLPCSLGGGYIGVSGPAACSNQGGTFYTYPPVLECPMCRNFNGATYYALGSAALGLDPLGQLVVSNLGLGAAEGARVELGGAWSYHAAFASIGPAAVGSSLRIAALGSLNGSLPRPLGTLSLVRSGSPDRVTIGADFSPISGQMARIEIYDRGTRIGVPGAAAGSVEAVADLASLLGVSARAGSGATALPGYASYWPVGTQFTLPGGAVVAGTEVRLLADVGAGAVEGFSEISILGTGLDQLTLARATPRTDCLPIGPIDSEMFDGLAAGWIALGSAGLPAASASAHLTTSGVQNTAGVCVFDQQPIVDPDFEIAFDFRISNAVGGVSDASGLTGPDGLACFVIGAPPAQPGGVGRDLGYGGFPVESFAVEFDAFQNLATSDPDSNHVGVDVGGSLTSIATAPVSPVFETPGTWRARLHMAGGIMSVFLQPPSGQELQVLQSAIPAVNTPALKYVGFSSGAGLNSADVDIDNITIVAIRGDCNTNGQADGCDVAVGGAGDCNSNGVPDACDIAAGERDDDHDGVPDACEVLYCQAGDVLVDGSVDGADIDAFVQCVLTGMSGAGTCRCGDFNGDSEVNVLDIPIFIGALTGP